MGKSEKALPPWSWEENKLFELTLSAVSEEDPKRWEVVAAMIGGHKSKDIQRHFTNLLQDLQLIESSHLDHKLEQEYVISAYSHSISPTDEDFYKFSNFRSSLLATHRIIATTAKSVNPECTRIKSHRF